MAFIKMIARIISVMMLLGSLASFAQSRLLADPALLLEKAVYLQEFEEDFEQALALYEQAAEESKPSSELRAKILYNWGNCLFLAHRCGEGDLVLNELMQQYEGSKWKQAVYDIHQTYYALNLRPPDWDENSIDIYIVSTMTGQEIGQHIQFAQKTQLDGRKAWKLVTIVNLAVYPSPHISKTWVDAESLLPIKQWASSPAYGDFRSTYFEDKVVTTVGDSSPAQEKETSFINPIYDNDEIIFIINLLPIQEGYVRNLQAYIPYHLLALNIRLKYKGLQDLSLPSGSVNARKLDLELLLGQQMANQEFYFSNDESQRLLGFRANNMNCLWEKSLPYPSGSRTAPVDLFPLNFTIPSEWIIYSKPSRSSDQLAGHTMLSLQDGSQCRISTWKVDPDTPFTKDQLREHAIEQAGKIEGFRWDNPEGEERMIDGHTFLFFTGSFTGMGSDYREWRIHGFDETHHYVLEMRCKKEHIETIEPVWNDLINSILFEENDENTD